MKAKFSYLYLSLVFTQTILILYLLQQKVTLEKAYTFYGFYVALLYILPTLAGTISDLWIGVRKGLLIGIIFVILGNASFIIYQNTYFCIGLALLIMGSGFIKSCCLSLTGILNKRLHVKEKAFNFLYVAANVAGALAPILYAYIGRSYGWNKVFIMNTIALTFAFIPFLFFSQKQHDKCQIKIKNPFSNIKNYFALSAVFIALFLIFLCSYSEKLGFYLVDGLFIFSLIYFGIIYIRQSSENRKRLILILLISFFGMFYYIGGMQVASTVTILIQDKINNGQVHFPYPASMFNSLYTIFIVIFSPFVFAIWKYTQKYIFEIHVFHKLAIGIGFGGLGLIFFALASESKIFLILLIAGIACLSLGELMLAPAVYTSISNYVPGHLKSTMMGYWLLFVALGGYLSSLFVRFFMLFSYSSVNLNFITFFSVGILVITSSVVLISATPKLNMFTKTILV